MGSLALALKYRPKVFSDLVGQETISQTLSMALDKDRIVHAYLFSGLRGSGKTSSARIFARALECEHGPTSKPCGECAICIATLEGKNIDIIEMDAASNRSIDSVRDLIEQTKYVPTMSRFKIFIIDEVHMLTKEAFNALLKTLEEPPVYVKFILATTDPLKLPATILSRTQHFRFKKIPYKSVIAHLEMILQKEEVGYEVGALDIIARSGGGSLRDTLTITDQAINYCDKYLTINQVAQMLGIVDPKNLRDFFSSIMHDDERGIVRALEILGEYECEMIIDEMLIFLKDMLLSESKDFSLLVIDRFLGILSQAKTLLNLNPDGAFVLLLMSLKMREAMKLQDISKAIKSLESSIASMDSSDLQASPSTPASIPTTTQSLSVRPLATTTTQAYVESNGESNTPIDAICTTTNDTTSSKQGVVANMHQYAFSQLVDKIADRSYELGEVFRRSVVFEQFIPAHDPSKPSVLIWQSRGDDGDKALLRQHFGLIRGFVQEVFAPHSSVPITIKNTQSSSSDDNPHSNSAIPHQPSPSPQESILESSLESKAQGDSAVDSKPSENVSQDNVDTNNSDTTSGDSGEPKRLKSSDLILYSTYEVRQDHISDAVYDEVPWRQECVPATSAPQTMEQIVDPTSRLSQPAGNAPAIDSSVSQDFHASQESAANATQNAHLDPVTEAFKKNNQDLIGGIKQHLGAKSMIIEASPQ